MPQVPCLEVRAVLAVRTCRVIGGAPPLAALLAAVFRGLLAKGQTKCPACLHCQAYRGIDPSVVPGSQIQDAGAVDFASSAGIDSEHAGCFMNAGHTYCVAPIVTNGTMLHNIGGAPRALPEDIGPNLTKATAVTTTSQWVWTAAPAPTSIFVVELGNIPGRREASGPRIWKPGRSTGR